MSIQEKTFKTSIRRDRMASVTFKEGSVDHAYTYLLGMAMCGDKKLSIIVDNAFEIIFSDEVDVFKEMIRFLEDKNPQLYSKGKKMLKERKKLLYKEASKYSLWDKRGWQRNLSAPFGYIINEVGINVLSGGYTKESSGLLTSFISEISITGIWLW